nr:tyrosine-type recombinase/integrase [uncultured Schaedlerella sp.]
MNSIYASDQFCQVIWPDFTAHFRNKSTEASYRTDVIEFMSIYQMDFLQITDGTVEDYYAKMQEKVEAGLVQPSTMAKKFRELHSLAAFICEERERYQIPGTFQDYFFPYLNHVAKIEKHAKSIPIDHIDQILAAAQDDEMAYCIFVLMQRAGLSSTEIAELKVEDFSAYDNGVYVFVTGRNGSCFVPEDAFIILEKYLASRTEQEYLFYNSRGNKLNTMYISRLMKKYTKAAGVPGYSAEALRNSCAVTMFAYNASPEQVARQIGVTEIQIKRYKNMAYRDSLMRAANGLVKIRVELPGK